MSRAERLLALLQILRRNRFPVAGATLAAELRVSLRTLYRDIASLQAQGAAIAGEAGLGYVLKPGFVLPPLMFASDEIEALVLGSRWVAGRADARLAEAARDALAKISAVLPAELRRELDDSALMIGPGEGHASDADLTLIRKAIRHERKLDITYRDSAQADSRRTIWPFALAYFDHARLVVAWCELRSGYRNFRADRITSLAPTDVRYPRRRQALLDEWRALEGIPPQ